MASGLWSHPLPLPQGRLPHAAPYSGLREYPGHTWALDSETVPIYDTLDHPNCDVLWACFCRNLLGLTQCLLLCGAVSQKYLLGRHYFHRGTMDRTCGTSIKVQFYLSSLTTLLTQQLRSLVLPPTEHSGTAIAKHPGPWGSQSRNRNFKYENSESSCLSLLEPRDPYFTQNSESM